ncbi:unnamed protein product [Sphagnum jensenii]|uniref:Gene product 88 domain-containing protein n=1 Tax=Sphagnum jensenii TaxID=128206 RepID=A0ABP0V5M2_9BRYO
MDTMTLLTKVNNDLALQFPAKHITITLDDIERVYFRNVLGIQADAKTSKGLGAGYLTGILYLAPASLSGINVCPKSSAGCRAACLFSAGRGRFYSTNRARIVKTLAYHFDTPRFISTIKKSIKSLLVKAKNKGLTPVVRLNGTSDILWERNSDIIQEFSGVQFYDYTKIVKRLNFSIPANYHLTVSLSESNEVDARFALTKGYNVAVVFRDARYPDSFLGASVVNGDSTDLRFLDVQGSGQGVIVALKAKGKAKRDDSGFVRDIDAAKLAA